MSTVPANTTGLSQESDWQILEQLRQANWQPSGWSSEYRKKGGTPPTYKAYFGMAIGNIVSFLEKMQKEGKTIGSYGHANYEAKDGFVIISRWELERLGVELKVDGPGLYR